MEFCRLCAKRLTERDCLEGIISLKNNSDGNDVDRMLGIFQGIEGNSKDLSDIACVECLDNLKFCHKFYTILDDATKFLVQRYRCKLKAYRPILPKPNDAAHDNAVNDVKTIPKSKRRYFCEECSSEFTTYRQILSHNKSHEIRNVCEYCGVFFTNGQAFNQHVLTAHSDLKFHCDKCQTTVRCRNTLFRHMKKIHNNMERGHTCSECHQLFLGRNSLENHIKDAHPLCLRDSDEETRCVDPIEDPEPDMIEEFLEDMDEEFLDDILLSQDQNSFCWDDLSLTPFDVEEMDMEYAGIDVPGGGSYVCPKCPDRYETPKSLIHHLAHEHNKFLLICNDVDCGASFNRYAKLKDHYINVHLKANTSDTTPNIRDFRQSTPLQCSTCKRNFKTPVGLKYHLKTHTGIKSLSCPYCEKKFIANVNLYAHMRNVHLEIKPHLCTLCDRRFASVDHLKKHVMSVHQKERNYLCNVCGKTFAQSSHLKQHLLTHSTRKSERIRRSK